MVTANTAFIVLEKVEDYIKYNITPPKELEKQCEDLQYVKKDTRPQRQRMKLSDEYEVLDRTVKAYNEKIRRWDPKTPVIELTRTEYENVLAGRVEGNNIVMQNKPVMSAASADINFGNNVSSLSEVVVTSAFGVRKALRTTPYSSQVISADQLNFVPQTNIVDALAGKVAGVQVRGQSDALLNQTGMLRIRGGLSMTDIEPLYVVDGTPVGAFDINPSDIDDVTVLKGANATALFGSRAFGGAIVVNTKKKNRNWYNYYNTQAYRLKDMEDVEYISDIKETLNTEKYQTYLQLREIYGTQTGFYFDMAKLFFEAGLKEEAYEILMNAAEQSKGHFQALRAVGFILESWKWFDKAIEVYESLLESNPSYTDIRRDLALAFYQNGNYQQAVTTLYNAIKDNVYDNEYWKITTKVTMLNEMNAIIALHKDSLNVDFIPTSLIRPLPVDLRIVVESNGSSLGNVSIKEPGGEVCSYTKPVTKKGFMDNNYYWYSTPAEYQTKNAKEGKYKVSVNYYGYNSWQYGIPDFIRIIAFRNFGKQGQQIKIDNVIMDNQYGEVEIGEVKW
jgi:TonB-dependent SusC/RagA subfamily outer membrane receptor